MNQGERQKIISILETKGAARPCPRCGRNDFSLMDGHFIQIIQDQPDKLKLSGSSIPSVVLICRNCGFIIQHALGSLGLIKGQNEKK